MNLPVVTDNDRMAHPYNSDAGIQAILLLNELSNTDLLNLLMIFDASRIFFEFKELFGANKWVLRDLFLWNSARDIGLQRKEIAKAVGDIIPPYKLLPNKTHK